MKRFEYKEFDDMGLNRLNKLGSEGWELVSATKANAWNPGRWLMKRQVDTRPLCWSNPQGGRILVPSDEDPNALDTLVGDGPWRLGV